MKLNNSSTYRKLLDVFFKHKPTDKTIILNNIKPKFKDNQAKVAQTLAKEFILQKKRNQAHSTKINKHCAMNDTPCTEYKQQINNHNKKNCYGTGKPNNLKIITHCNQDDSILNDRKTMLIFNKNVLTPRQRTFLRLEMEYQLNRHVNKLNVHKFNIERMYTLMCKLAKLENYPHKIIYSGTSLILCTQHTKHITTKQLMDKNFNFTQNSKEWIYEIYNVDYWKKDYQFMSMAANIY